ncbi:MAG: ribonuclease HII, partial [Bacillota bacterium]
MAEVQAWVGEQPRSRWPRLAAILAADRRAGVQRLGERLRRELKAERAERRRFDGLLAYEKPLWEAGVHLVAGLDEAGRGPLAGPVCAAAVVLRPGTYLPNL